MANEPMELAKNYDEKRTPFPALAQVKYDGVPLVFTIKHGSIVALSRQNEYMQSVPHLINFVRPILDGADQGACIIAECLVPGSTFKESSGIIRRHKPDPRITGVVFDGWLMDPSDSYNTRFNQLRTAIVERSTKWVREAGSSLVCAPSELVLDHTEAMEHWDKLKRIYGSRIEGMMLHHTDKSFSPGKRCWGMGRFKPQPTIDLEVISYEEAFSEGGEPLGMVGRINVELARRDRAGNVSRSVIGIGPGKMSHDERRAVWRAAAVDLTRPERFAPFKTIAEIKYMPDPSYDALRQPTFQRFRTDKEFPDVLEY